MRYRPNKHSKSADFKISRRLIQEYGFEEARRIGALDNLTQQKNKQHKIKTQLKAEKRRRRKKNKLRYTQSRTGENYTTEYKNFIDQGGDPSSCPFD